MIIDNIKGSLIHSKLASFNDSFNENESTLNQSGGCQPCVNLLNRVSSLDGGSPCYLLPAYIPAPYWLLCQI